MSLHLITNFLSIIRKGIKEFREKKKEFFLMGWLLLLIFEFFLMMIFFASFKFIINVPGGYLFAPKVMAIIIMIVFYITLFISFITAIPTLYRNPEVKFLLSSPTSHLDIFKLGIAKILFFASWGSLLIIIPAFIGFGIINKFGILYYLLAFFIIAALTILAVLIGILLCILFFKLILGLKKLYRNLILLLGGIGLIGYLLSKVPQIVVQNNETGVSFIENFVLEYNYSNILMPYNWLGKLINYFMANEGIAILIYLMFITLTTIVLYLLLILIARKYYFDSIQNLENFSFFKIKRNISYRTFFLKNKYLNLLTKDILIHIKDPIQWSQMIIFLVLLLIYMVTLRGTNIQQLDNITVVTILTLSNILLSGFFVSSIALRFVFPNISLEGRSFWVLKTSPIDLKIFYILKIVFFGFFLTILGYILSYFHVKIVGIKPEIAYFIYIVLLPLILFLISSSFVLGCFYPDFKETNPSKIATSLPGLLSVFLTNAAIMLMLLAIYPSVYKFYGKVLGCHQPGLQYFSYHILIISGLALLATGIIVWYGYRRFKEVEM